MEFHGKARNYKFYISISCGTTSDISRNTFKSDLYAKDSCNLRFTTADSDFYYSMLREDHYDTGIKEKHIRLINPTKLELSNSISQGMNYLNQYSEKKDWKGGEITFIFSGHGRYGCGSIELKDDSYSAKNLLEDICAAREKNKRRIRINLILDSCYSGAFLIGLASESLLKYENDVFFCDGWSSSSFNEVSFESEKHEHGLFTYIWKEKRKKSFDELIDHLRNGGEEITIKSISKGEQNPITYVNGNIDLKESSFCVYDLPNQSYESIVNKLS